MRIVADDTEVVNSLVVLVDTDPGRTVVCVQGQLVTVRVVGAVTVYVRLPCTTEVGTGQ